jgi:hypothetical protein
VRAQGELSFDPATVSTGEADTDPYATGEYDDHEEEMIAARGGLMRAASAGGATGGSGGAPAARYSTPSTASAQRSSVGYDSLPGVGTTSG